VQFLCIRKLVMLLPVISYTTRFIVKAVALSFVFFMLVIK